VAQRWGIRNLYLTSAAMLLAIGAIGLTKLRRPAKEAEQAVAVSAE